MGDLKLQGHSGLFGHEVPVQHRKLLHVSDQEIKDMTHNNNTDEIVVQTKSGEKHIVFADELSVKGGKLPKVGDTVNLPFLDESAKVLHVDDEWNEDMGFAAAALGGGLVGLGLAKLSDTASRSGGIKGNTEAIRHLSIEADVSHKELEWAKQQMLHKSDGKKLSKAEQATLDDIQDRQGKQEKINKTPYPDCPTLTNGDIHWALKLEEKVKAGYTPQTAEIDRYQSIADTLNKHFNASQSVQGTVPEPGSGTTSMDRAIKVAKDAAQEAARSAAELAGKVAGHAEADSTKPTPPQAKRKTE